MRTRMVLIAYPIRDRSYRQDLAVLRKIIDGVRAGHRRGEHRSVPVAPYLLHAEVLGNTKALSKYWTSEVKKRRRWGFRHDALWLYGDEITRLMRSQIAYARRMGIPVMAKSDVLKPRLERLLKREHKKAVPESLALAA